MPADPPFSFAAGEALARHTSLELGGPADWFVRATERAEVPEIVAWAWDRGHDLHLLGGGSNVVAADRGVRGVVMRVELAGVDVLEQGAEVLVTAAAGENWDQLVARAVASGWAGLECLSGIPGTVGATPIQNVGAYGTEVAECLDAVEVFDRVAMEESVLSADDLGLAYRTSRLRRDPNRFIVLAVRFRLRAGGRPTIRYPELEREVAAAEPGPDLNTVRQAVMRLRRSKSMVLDPDDPNRRSVGSFFVNPVVDRAQADRVVARAVSLGLATEPAEVPRFEANDGRTKIPAAWLIERAGFSKAWRRGAVGISSAHALALVHHGGGTAADLIAVASEIRDRVAVQFGVVLQPEPVLWGFSDPGPLTSPPDMRRPQSAL